MLINQLYEAITMPHHLSQSDAPPLFDSTLLQVSRSKGITMSFVLCKKKSERCSYKEELL